jgi:hypothetical protein
MRRRCSVPALTAVSLLLITPAELRADDRSREGFFTSLGMGWGESHDDRTFTIFLVGIGREVEVVEEKSGDGLALDLKLGAGLSQETLLYFVTRSSRIGDDTAGVMGIGIARFLRPVAPSFYFLGMFGLSRVVQGGVTIPFTLTGSGSTGMGVGAGIGYEFLPYLGLEATVTFGNPEWRSNPLAEEKHSFLSFVVTVQGTLY